MDLPLYIDDHRKGNSYSKKINSGSCISNITGIIKSIWATYESRNIFLFLLVNLSFAFVELIWGAWTNSLGLITDSFHMFFDCSALVAGLAASLVAKWPANDMYRYGYSRAEVLGGFVNGLFLIFVALFIITEAVERFFEPPDVGTEMLMEVSVAGLLVNILGIFAFQHAHTHGGEQCHGHGAGGSTESHSSGGHGHDCGHAHAKPKVPQSCNHGHSHGSDGSCSSQGHDSHTGHGHADHSHSHQSPGSSCSHGHSQAAPGHSDHGHSHASTKQNTDKAIKGESRSLVLDGVMLHVIADTLGSVSVIISSFLIKQYGWMVADPIGSLFVSALILISVYPLLKKSTQILMQRTPEQLDPFLLGAFQQVTAINGVVEYSEPRFWTLSGNEWYGTISLLIRPDANGYVIQSLVASIFAEIGVGKMTIQVKQF